VRRAKNHSVISLPAMARRGVSSCAIGLVLLAILPQLVATNMTTAVRLLQGAAVCLAFTSATVVNSLTAYASLQCDESVDKDTGKPTAEHPQLAKGKALGQFRSSGQLGRALGPLLGRSPCTNHQEYSNVQQQPVLLIGRSGHLSLTLSAQQQCCHCPSV
jgi:hypothetical protein